VQGTGVRARKKGRGEGEGTECGDEDAGSFAEVCVLTGGLHCLYARC
jgi:hypothetical protein